MADNQALKLLVAGIIGAVIGAAAADRYHLPAGMVYGFKRSTGHRTRLAIDQMAGSARAIERLPPDGGPQLLWPPPPPWPDWQPPWGATRSEARTALCWREYEDWDFGTTGYYVRCPGRSRTYRPRDG